MVGRWNFSLSFWGPETIFRDGLLVLERVSLEVVNGLKNKEEHTRWNVNSTPWQYQKSDFLYRCFFLKRHRMCLNYKWFQRYFCLKCVTPKFGSNDPIWRAYLSNWVDTCCNQLVKQKILLFREDYQSPSWWFQPDVSANNFGRSRTLSRRTESNPPHRRGPVVRGWSRK